MTRDELMEMAAKALNTSVEDVSGNIKEIPEINGYYIWQNMRGGNSVIFNDEGERLRATSMVSFERHLEAFKKGKRN